MKRLKIAILALLALSATSVTAQNTYDGLTPGLYSVSDGKAISMKHETARITTWDTDLNGAGLTDIEIAHQKFHYKKHSSVNKPCQGKFIMVTDPERKAIVQTLRKYNPFMKTMTPENMLLIGFEQEKKGRLYDCTHPTVKGLEIEWDHKDFKWNKLADNVFEIDATALPAGEYAFLFRISDLAGYKFDAAYTFTKE